MRSLFARFSARTIPVLACVWGFSALGCSATAAESGPGRNNNNGSGATSNASGGTDSAGSGGTPGSGGTVGPVGGNSSTAGTSSGSGGTPTTGGTGPTGSGGGGVVHPPANTDLPYLEDFEDGEAGGWIDSVDDSRAPLGTWVILDDGGTMVYQHQNPSSNASWAVGGDIGWVDQHLETKMKFVSGAEDGLVTISIRFSGFKAHYFLEVTADRIKLRDRVDSGSTDLTEWDITTPFVDGEWHTVGFSAIGSNLTVYFDGAPVAMATSSSNPFGGIAFSIEDAVVSFDDVTVTAE